MYPCDSDWEEFFLLDRPLLEVHEEKKTVDASALGTKK